MRPAETSVPAFRREFVLESFDMSNSALATSQNDNKDIIPPARIIDLRVVETSLAHRTVAMIFTPPGDDLDQIHGEKGQMVAVRYDVRISSNMSELYHNFNSAFQLKTEHLIGDDFDRQFTSYKKYPVLR